MMGVCVEQCPELVWVFMEVYADNPDYMILVTVLGGLEVDIANRRIKS